MHAALISLLLMSGACGDVPPVEFAEPPDVSVSVPPLMAPKCHCTVPGCGSCCNPAATCMYHNCPEYNPPCQRTWPAWKTGYYPACYFYPRHRMLFHPADWTQPYDYRNRVNFPWDDPRCPCAVPPIGY